MMAMANNEPMPSWRNVAAWSAVGAIFYILIISASALFLHENGMRQLFPSNEVAAKLGLGLILTMACLGFSSRKRSLSLRTFRNFLILNTVALAFFLLVLRGFSALDGASALAAMGASGRVASVSGSVLVVFAFLCMLALASVHTGADLIDDEVAADELRERGRLHLVSLAWMAACGLLLIGLGLSGPGGLLSPAAALAGASILLVVLVVLWIVAWRLSDELMRTLSLESGNIALYLILALGGGWAMLAHLGFVQAPAPLDWMTMFTMLLFAASFIAVGRRKLLTR